MSRRTLWIPVCLLMLACNAEPEEKSPPEAEPIVRLDLDGRVLRQPVGPEAVERKFVRVEIEEVYNPRKIRTTFEVHYEPAQGEKVLLGTFSLFPPNNPGNFIVATGGRVRAGGVLVLSMKPLDHLARGDTLRIEMRPMRFVDD